ncbi:MAG: DUF1156 domain-containing protein [Conexivisphaerales archaeon]|jgi:adenine-specific DNA methylase
MDGSVHRLVEVDLPIRIISENALKEQNVRKGHLHSIHVWWATRPLATCRAILLASLLPDPVDKACPEEFRQKAAELLDMLKGRKLSDPLALREALLDFIGNFSSWESSNDSNLLEVARKLVSIVNPDAAPLIVDPFGGIGSIPFEALRIGGDAYAQDLNPVATLLLKTNLELMPRFGMKLAEAVDRWGNWVEDRVKQRLMPFYPTYNRDTENPFVYIWARVVRCEGPDCGAEVPLVGLLWLSQEGEHRVALRYHGDKKTKKVEFDIFEPNSEDELQEPIVNRFTATCPVCGYTTPYASVGRQLTAQHGGTKQARMITVISIRPDGKRTYRIPLEQDLEAVDRATRLLDTMRIAHKGPLSMIPDEATPVARGPGASRAFSVRRYGIERWEDAFGPRQALALATLVEVIHDAYEGILKETGDLQFAQAVNTCISLAVSGNLVPYLSALSVFLTKGMETAFKPGNVLPMRPDFAEANPLVPRLAGGFDFALDQVVRVLQREGNHGFRVGTANRGPATDIALPDHSVDFVFTDPPYYDAIPYAGLSDICYVWLRRMLGPYYPELFLWNLTPKAEECILDPGSPDAGEPEKDRAFFENTMRKALVECRRVLKQDGIGVVLFAHKGTAGWEAMLKALVDAKWIITASWPIETERGARMRAYNSAVLSSSIFLVCRPRVGDEVGDWREIISELQPRMHTWMGRLREEKIEGADAIFACLGPALEIYSRYNRVETAGGKRIDLADNYGEQGELAGRGYLSYVWEAVAKEALHTIFEGVDPTGFEQDSRLTAMWLWTLRSKTNGINKTISSRNERTKKKAEKEVGYGLEYDAARKIAQGLGARIEELSRPGGTVRIKGGFASLLFSHERREALLEGSIHENRTVAGDQMTLFGGTVTEMPQGKTEVGRTTLDRLHQAMLLFGEGKSEALKRFLVDEEVGKNDRFWRLANALVALYPKNTDDRRWVEGVLARKKSLGL